MEIPISMIDTIISTTGDIAEKILSETDFSRLRALLMYYTHGINSGKMQKQDITVQFLIEHLKTTDKITDVVLDVIKLAINIQVTDTFLYSVIDVLKSFPTNAMLHLFAEFLHYNILSNLLILEIFEVFIRSKYVEQPFLYLVVAPNCINFVSNQALSLLWNHSLLMEDLTPICYLSNYFFDLNGSLSLCLDNNFWVLLLKALEATPDKITEYVLKSAVEALNSVPEIPSLPLLKNWQYLDKFVQMILIAKEKQVHLVQPALSMLPDICLLHESWINIIFRKLLNHPNVNIAAQTAIYFFGSKEYLPDFLEDLLKPFNKADGDIYCALAIYVEKLSASNIEIFVERSLVNVTWTPASFYKFYSIVLELRHLNFKLINTILKKAIALPNVFIRTECIKIITDYIVKCINEGTEIVNIMDILQSLIELYCCEQYITFGRKVMSEKELLIDNEFLNTALSWFQDSYPQSHKIYLVMDVFYHHDVDQSFLINHCKKPFLKRSYNYIVLDTLTYLHNMKSSDCQEYLKHRLDVDVAHERICFTDKVRKDLYEKAYKVLVSNSGTVNQKCLAFDIIFYANRDISSELIDTVETNNINSKLAFHITNLFSRISKNQLQENVDKIIDIYYNFLETQNNEVALRIFKNIEDCLESLKNPNLIKSAIKRLDEMRCDSNSFDLAAKWFIRGIGAKSKIMDSKISSYALKELYEMSHKSEIVMYYTTVYFKTYQIDLMEYPMYNYILMGDVLTKEMKMEFDVCKFMQNTEAKINPVFRMAQIRKMSLEAVLSSRKPMIDHVAHEFMDVLKRYSGKRYFPDSKIMLDKYRVLQSLCMMEPELLPSTKQELTRLLVDSFCTENHQPAIRQLMQFLLLRLSVEDKTNYHMITGSIDNTDKMHVSTVSGLIPVLYGLDIFSKDVEFSINLIDYMLAWTMGANFKLRSSSQYTIFKILQRKFSRKLLLTYDAVFKALKKVMEKLDDIDQAIITDLEFIEHIYIYDCFNDGRAKRSLLAVKIPERTNVAIVEWEYYKFLENPVEYMDMQDTSFLKRIKRDLQNVTPKENEDDNIQRKIIPFPLAKINAGSNSDFILITTLVASAANLGGLCRTSEILGIKDVVLYSGKIVENKEFKSLSMSSELWLNVHEVRESDLIDYIISVKKNGYTVIGAEQTSNSVKLNEFVFPKKTALVLGNERSGMPSNIIGLMDVCVEIPQYGAVRSFNVHVAGAMFMWEYRKQNVIS